MPRATPLINAFNAGEVTGTLSARADLDKYYQACRTLKNFIPLVEGGATFSPGTYFVLPTKNNGIARLKEFHFSTVQAYICEFGEEYIRFYKENGQISTVDSYTKLLLHCDEDFTDSGYTVHTVTSNGDAQISTAQKKFGTGSALFDGTGDYLSVADHADWDFGANPFTIDFWVRFENVSQDAHGLVSQYEDADNYFFLTYVTGTGIIQLDIWSGGVRLVRVLSAAALGLVADTWYHIAVIRGWAGVTNNWAFCLDGQLTGSIVSDADSWPNYTGNLDIGRSNHGGITTYYLGGWIDEVRISKGVARWTTDFIPPTQPYPFVDVSTLTGGGSVPVEVVTPYAEEDLFELKFTQSADVLYITHPDYPPKTLTRTSHTSWQFTDFIAILGEEMTIKAITKDNPAKVTCDNVWDTLENGDTVFLSGIGGMTELNNQRFQVSGVFTGPNGYFNLVGVNSTGYTTYTSGGTAVKCLFGAINGYPACSTFFEQRLVFASTNNNPQTFWLSATAGYTDFIKDPDDDSSAIEYTIGSNRVDRIRWIIAQDYLFLGTVGGIWKVGAATQGDPLTQASITAKKQGPIGVKDIEPELVSDAVLWVTRSGIGLRQLSYYYITDKYELMDLTRIASHITVGSDAAGSGIKDMTFVQEPQPILWSIRNDGVLLGMTYETQEKIYAWFRIVTDGLFESVAAISRENQEDEAWVVVQRTIDGTTKRYVEYFKPFEIFSQIKDAFHLHSGLTWDGGSPVTITDISQANPAVVTAPGHGFLAGNKVHISSVVGMTEANQDLSEAYTVANPTTTTFELSGVDSSGWTAYASGGQAQKMTNHLTGLDHLEGKQVSILIDGAVHSPKPTVVDGAIDLEWYGNKIHVGLSYEGILEPMNIHAGSQVGTSRGKKQKISKLTLCFYETYGGKAGPDYDSLKDIPFGVGASPELVTEDIEFIIDSDWKDESQITVVQDLPLPMTVLALVPDVKISE